MLERMCTAPRPPPPLHTRTQRVFSTFLELSQMSGVYHVFLFVSLFTVSLASCQPWV